MRSNQPGDAVLEARSVHFVGIAGTGMQALAEVLLARQVEVSGSDARTSPAVERLAASGALTFIGHAAEQLGQSEAVVVSAAVPENNPEIQEARRRGLPIATHAQVLGALSRRMMTIAVAGTHGKSTTTALTAHILIESGLDPVVSGGAYAPNLGGSGRAGRGALLVVEADEFARRFLELSPQVAIITNVEPDHLDYYGSVEAMEATFGQFLKRLHTEGHLLSCADAPAISAIREDPRRIPYGESADAEWRVSEYRGSRDGLEFTLGTPAGERFEVNSHLRGRHNALNATAAVAAASLVGVAVPEAIRAVSTFAGTERRFQTVLCSPSMWVVDDYAHHPTEIRATLRAARESHGGRIWAVFQPHTSHRTRALFDDFVMAFEDADEVLVLPIYHPSGREPTKIDVSSVELASAVPRHSRAVASMEDAASLLKAEARSGDLVLLMGAGDVTNLGPRLARELGGGR